MSEEWGPWIEHDGNGCTLAAGTICQCEFEDGRIDTPSPVMGGGGSWDRRLAWKFYQIIRYRIRKPKGMEILDEIVRNPERELEDA